MKIYYIYNRVAAEDDEYYVLVPIFSWDKETVPLVSEKGITGERLFGIRKERKTATIFEPDKYPKIIKEYDKVPEDIFLELMKMGYDILKKISNTKK